VTTYYIEILPGTGYASGINDIGEVVGTIIEGDSLVPAWWIPTPGRDPLLQPQYTLGTGIPPGNFSQFSRIDNSGNAIGLQEPSLFNIKQKKAVAKLPFTDAVAINNNNLVVGGDVVFNWKTQKQVGAPIPPPDGTTPAIAQGMNNLGDVVGSAGMNGFFYSGNVHYFNENLGLILVDINDSRIAIGTVATGGGQPVYMNLQSLDPIPQPSVIPFADDGTAVGIGDPVGQPSVNAINGGNTIVGSASGGGGTLEQTYPFVYQIGQTGSASNLNDLIFRPGGWYLEDAVDINAAGQIVGAATSGIGQAGYVATPILIFRELPGLIQLLGNVLRSLDIRESQSERPAATVQQRRTLASARKRMFDA
jgi:hypothetical protein